MRLFERRWWLTIEWKEREDKAERKNRKGRRGRRGIHHNPSAKPSRGKRQRTGRRGDRATGRKRRIVADPNKMESRDHLTVDQSIRSCNQLEQAWNWDGLQSTIRWISVCKLIFWSLCCILVSIFQLRLLLVQVSPEQRWSNLLTHAAPICSTLSFSLYLSSLPQATGMQLWTIGLSIITLSI